MSAQNPNPPGEGAAPAVRACVLLVDDEPANLLALEVILEDLGHDLVRASSGQQALALAARRDFAVILLDVQMPGLDGFETAARIRRAENGRHAPIIFLTAYEDERFPVHKAYALGAVDYLLKPIVPVILRAKVAGFVDLYAEKERAKRQGEQLRLLIHGSTDHAIFMLDLTGRIATWNTGAERINGYRADEIVGQHFSRFYPPDAAQRGWPDEELRRAAAVGRYEEEGWRVRKDGSRFWASVVITALRDEGGRLVGFGKVTRDLSERREKDEVLGRMNRDLEQRVQERTLALASSNEALQTKIAELEQAEQTVRSLLRISERLGSSLDVDTLLDVLVQEAMALVGAGGGVAGLYTPEGMLSKRYFEGGEVLPLEYCWPPMHGLPGWLITHKAPYLTNNALADGQVVRELCVRFGVRQALSVPILDSEKGLLGFFEVHNKGAPFGFTAADVERLVAASQIAAVAIQNALAYRQVREAEDSLRVADRRKDEFMAMLAHELRNPLAPIRTAAQIIRLLAPSDANVQRSRDVIERQVLHLTRMVDDLLDVSRLTRGKVTLHKQRLDLAQLAGHAVGDCRSAFEAAQLTLSLEAPQVPVWVEADPTRLTQVLDNYLQNALKFTGPGGRVTVLIEAGPQKVVARVRDTGSGIAADVLPRLFEAFSQAEQSLDRSNGGLGLGLAVVKGLVELHGGSVWASSAGPDQGAEFAFELQRQPEPEALTARPSQAPRAARRLRILVVEDNRDAAESLRLLLQLSGHEVQVAHSGTEGVQKAASWRPEVVICDVGLPGMSGHEVVAELRRDPATARARVIALTGYGSEEDRHRSRVAGFDLHLTKPVEPAVLHAAITQTLA